MYHWVVETMGCDVTQRTNPCYIIACIQCTLNLVQFTVVVKTLITILLHCYDLYGAE